jgi:hypothetical protein
MARTRDSDHVISQGSLRKSDARVDYYTTTPAPSQWIAVGVLMLSAGNPNVEDTRRLIVGNGTDERQAIADLNKKFGKILDSMHNGSAPREKNRGVSDSGRLSLADEMMTEDQSHTDDDPPTVHH